MDQAVPTAAARATGRETGRTFPADEVVWGFVVRPGFDELDDPFYHRGTTQHAYLEGNDLRAFEQRAAALKGLPPLNIDKLYVITEDDQLRDGEMVLFIGLRADCVKTVFGLPTKLYRELAGKPTA